MSEAKKEVEIKIVLQITSEEMSELETSTQKKISSLLLLDARTKKRAIKAQEKLKKDINKIEEVEAYLKALKEKKKQLEQS